MDVYIYYVSYFLYFLATGFYLSNILKENQKALKIGKIILSSGLVLHTVAILLRWVIASRPPFSNQYEFAFTFSWGIALVFIVMMYIYKINNLGIFITPVLLLVATYSLFLSKEIQPLMPALRSNWLFFHVFTAVLGYGAFAVAFGLGILFIMKNIIEKRYTQIKKISREDLDYLIYRINSFGFLFLTITIITGAIWAQKAWTRYWAWDPKETWSLVTWIIYAVFLHIRISRGVRGNKLAWFSIIGFVSVMFTYVGVNYVLPSLHSYM